MHRGSTRRRVVPHIAAAGHERLRKVDDEREQREARVGERVCRSERRPLSRESSVDCHGGGVAGPRLGSTQPSHERLAHQSRAPRVLVNERLPQQWSHKLGPHSRRRVEVAHASGSHSGQQSRRAISMNTTSTTTQSQNGGMGARRRAQCTTHSNTATKHRPKRAHAGTAEQGTPSTYRDAALTLLPMLAWVPIVPTDEHTDAPSAISSATDSGSTSSPRTDAASPSQKALAKLRSVHTACRSTSSAELLQQPPHAYTRLRKHEVRVRAHAHARSTRAAPMRSDQWCSLTQAADPTGRTGRWTRRCGVAAG
jgi:hypothetical protein